MITTIRTCDKCNEVITPDQYNFAQKIKVHIGHYDHRGTELELCSGCWSKLYAIYAPPKPIDPTAPEPTQAERVNRLMEELFELLTPQQ
jgi:hypothetical protein